MTAQTNAHAPLTASVDSQSVFEVYPHGYDSVDDAHYYWVVGTQAEIEKAIEGMDAGWGTTGVHPYGDDIDFRLPMDQDALRVRLAHYSPTAQAPVLSDFHAVYEVTGAGFDGADDCTDDRVVWVYGSEASIKPAIAGTGAIFGGEVVIREDHPDVDFHLPHERDALRERLLAFVEAPGGA